jgi:hypothetical protein
MSSLELSYLLIAFSGEKFIQTSRLKFLLPPGAAVSEARGQARWAD